MTNRPLILAALLALAGCDTSMNRPPEPTDVRYETEAIPGLGLVGCEVIAEDGSSLRMTILDGPDEMFIRTPSSSMSLPRDEELTDATTHVAAIKADERTVAVTLNINLEMTVTTIDGPRVRLGQGQCAPI